MLQAYSTNQTITTGSELPFTSVTLKKGNTAVLSGTTSIELNKVGVYMITLNTSLLPTEAGTVTIEMLRNGVPVPQATVSMTGLTTVSLTPTITTLVQVPTNNTNCCSSGPVTIEFMNTGVGVTATNLNVVVTKIC